MTGIAHIIMCIIFAVSLAACARPTGDFGRVSNKFTIVHDWILPSIGFLSANWRAELVSQFNFTELEIDMRERAWSLVSPPHHKQWLAHLEAEWRRTRILHPLTRQLSVDAYHRHLKREKFASSDARWNRLIDDLNKDTNLIDPFYLNAKQVLTQDRNRLKAYDDLQAIDKTRITDFRDVTGRVQENDDIISWVLLSLEYRYHSYYVAWQRLQIEEPASTRALDNKARRALSRLHSAIEAARADLNPQEALATTNPVAAQPKIIKR